MLAAESLEAPQPRALTGYTYIIIVALWLAGIMLPLSPFVPVLMEVTGAKAAGDRAGGIIGDWS
ncbi:MAG: hypothetical protein ACREUL_19140 [Steroidobacteraceae bacterium]